MSIVDAMKTKLDSDNTGIAKLPPNGTAFTANSAATTNATLVSNTATNLYELAASNIAASPRYLKLYNKATAPTVGTDIPVLIIPIAASSFISLNFGVIGKRFDTGLGYAITANAAITDATVIGADEVQVAGTRI